MKIRYPITRSVILLAILGLMVQACTKGMSPTAPSASTVTYNPTATPVISAGVSEIYWYSAALLRSNVLGSGRGVWWEVKILFFGHRQGRCVNASPLQWPG